MPWDRKNCYMLPIFFIPKDSHFRKYLARKIQVFSMICLISLSVTSEPVYPPTPTLMVLLRWAFDFRREDTWFSVTWMQQYGLQNSLFQRLAKLLFGVQMSWLKSHTFIRHFCHIRIKIYSSAVIWKRCSFIVLSCSVSASKIFTIFIVIALLLDPPAPSNSAVVI